MSSNSQYRFGLWSCLLLSGFTACTASAGRPSAIVQGGGRTGAGGDSSGGEGGASTMTPGAGGAGSGGTGGAATGGTASGGVSTGGAVTGGTSSGGRASGGVTASGSGGKGGTGGSKTGGMTATGSGGGGGNLGGMGGGTFSGEGVTTQGIFIPAAHPRLFWTSTRLAQGKQWWSSHSFVPDSDRYSMQDQLTAAVLGGNSSYCAMAIKNAMAVDLKDCVPSKAGCDEARWDGENAILTYDWCYSQMTEDQRTTFRSNWNTWIRNTLAQSWGGIGDSQSNYYWGNVRNALEWGIASYQENKAAADEFLTHALVTRFQNDFNPASIATGKAAGGLGLEGGQYGPYQSYYMSAIVFPSVASSGRDLWTETPYWKGAVLNRIYMTPPRQTTAGNGLRSGWDTFPFGDDENWQNGGSAGAAEIGTFMLAAADRWGSANIGQWAAQWSAMVQPVVDDAIESTVGSRVRRDWSTLPTEYYDAGPRYLVGRTNWSDAATVYLWQMGDHYNDGHNHDDWGAFQINRKGRWLTRETVGYTEAVAGYGGTGSVPLYSGYAHNVPFINGRPGVVVQGFPPSPDYEGNWNSSPVVHRLDVKSAYTFANVDLTGVYHCCPDGADETNNAAAVHVERDYWFIRDLETFVILDRLQTDTAGRSRTFVVHCETNPTLVDATHVDCVNGDQQLAITTLLPTAPSSRTVVDVSRNASPPPPRANSQYRVEINDMPNATLSYTLHVMQAMDRTGTKLSPSVTDSSPGTPASGNLVVTLDAQHSITIAKGMASSSGSITISGTTTNLRADVEGFGLNADDTPTWAP